MHEGHIYEPAEENPEFALRHYGRALQLLRAGDTRRAIEELERVIEYDPSFPGARDMLKKASGMRSKQSLETFLSGEKP